MFIRLCFLHKIADFASKREMLKDWLIRKKPTLTPQEVDQKVEEANRADPTGPLGVYTWWILKRFVDGNIILPEDIDRVRGILDQFNRSRNRADFRGEKDINRYDTIQAVETVLPGVTRQMKEEVLLKTERGKEEILRGLRKLDEEGPYILYEVTTPEALVYVSSGYSKGQSVNWCTKHYSTAVQYLSGGPLYMITRKDEGDEEGMLFEGRRYVLIDPYYYQQFKDLKDREFPSSVYQRVRNLLLKNGVYIARREAEWLVRQSKEVMSEEDLKLLLSHLLKYLFTILFSEYGFTRMAYRVLENWCKGGVAIDPLNLPVTIKVPSVDIPRVLEEKLRGFGLSKIQYHRLFEFELFKEVMGFVNKFYNKKVTEMLKNRLKVLHQVLEELFEKERNRKAKQMGYPSFREVPEDRREEIDKHSETIVSYSFTDLFGKVFVGDLSINTVDMRRVIEETKNEVRNRFSIEV